MMMAKLNKGQAPDLTNIRGVIEPYLTTLIQIFQNSEGNIRPAEAWQQFRAIHGDNDENTPTEQQVKIKISELKSKARRG